MPHLDQPANHSDRVRKWLHLRQRWHEASKWWSQWQWRRNHKDRPKRVVLMAGYQRSGTNMLMQALDQHPLTNVFHENDPRLFSDYALKADANIAHHIRRARGDLLVIKTLLDAHRYGPLSDLAQRLTGQHPLLLWPLRKLDDLVNSHMVRWPQNREQIDAILGDGQISTWRGRGLSGPQLQHLRQLYRPDISNADCKALGWMMRNYLPLKEDFPRHHTLLLDYEQMVTSPTHMLQQLLIRLDLPWDRRTSQHIHARSISKDAPPSLDPDIRAACARLEQQLRASLSPLT